MEIQLQVFWFIFPVSNKQEQACSSHSSHTTLAMSVIECYVARGDISDEKTYFIPGKAKVEHQSNFENI